MATLNAGVQAIKSLFGSGFYYVRGYIANTPGTDDGHDGIDLAAKAGTPVRALTGGTVTYARDARQDPNPRANWAERGGNVVRIGFDGRHEVGYAHLQSFVVREGQKIRKGDVIGYVGSTGYTKGGPHLHVDLLDRTNKRMVSSANEFARIISTTPLPLPGSDNGKVPDYARFVDRWLASIGKSRDDVITREDLREYLIYVGMNSVSRKREDAEGFADELLGHGIGNAFVGKTWGELAGAGEFDPADPGTGDPLAMLAGMLGSLFDPANWIRILALIAGAAMAAWGGINVLRAAA